MASNPPGIINGGQNDPIQPHPVVGPVPGTNPPPATVGPTPGPSVPGLFTAGSAVGEIVGFIDSIWHDLNQAITESQQIDLGGMYNHLSKWVDKFPLIASLHEGNFWQNITDISVGTFYRDMLEYGLGVKVDEFDKLAKDGVKTVDTMLGFAYIMPWIVSAVALAGKIPLAGRWIEFILEPISKLPEEMGLSWALGVQIEQAFEAAVGQSIEEGILEQKRSTRVEWPVLRQAWRQGLLQGKEFELWMSKLGYPPEQIKFLSSLDLNQLGVGDLARLWQYGIFSRTEFRQYLRKAGTSEDDINSLTELYITHAQSQAGAMLRSTARALVQQHLISEDQYKQILMQTQVPEREWKDDLAAIKLENSTGRLNETVTAIKTAYIKGNHDAHQAKAGLTRLGYSPAAQASLINSWDLSNRPHPMSLAKVLSYYVSGVLTRAQARDRMLELNIAAADVTFYLAHPQSSRGVRIHTVTPSLLVQAFLDGALKEDELRAKLHAIQMDDAAIDYTIKTAMFRKSRQKRPAGDTIPLSVGQIVDAWAYGIWDLHTAINELEHLGYSADHAMLILEIKNKGAIDTRPAPPPLFATLGDAIAFLRSEGYGIIQPTDPRVSTAEQMLAMAGYGWLPPGSGVGGNPQDQLSHTP